MHILVLGAAGMVGRKLCERLLRDGRLGKSEITKLTMHDVVEPKKPEKAGFAVETVSGDFAVPGAAERADGGGHDRLLFAGRRGILPRSCPTVPRIGAPCMGDSPDPALGHPEITRTGRAATLVAALRAAYRQRSWDGGAGPAGSVWPSARWP